jgi:hypothetical protein
VRRFAIALATVLAVTSVHADLSDKQIRQILIDESIAAYEGSCPCPYSRARNGSRCGKRSAHSKAGGEEPLCYAEDVSDDTVRAYREGNERR